MLSMRKVSIREKLFTEGEVNRGIVVSSNLVKELEIYGFVNCSYDDSLLSGVSSYPAKGNIQLSSRECLIYSYYLRKDEIVHPVYRTVAIAHESVDINVENLYIPSYRSYGQYGGNWLYNQIKSRYGTGKTVTDNEWVKGHFPSRFSMSEGKVFMHIEKGEVVLKDKFGVVRSVEEEAIAVCRYLNLETGEIQYLFYCLDEIFYEEKETKVKDKKK